MTDTDINKTKSWGKPDDAKLYSLLKQKKNGIDPHNLDIDYIKQVIQAHFPHRTYKNLSQLYRKKVRKYNVNESLKGARSKKKKGKYRQVHSGFIK